MKISVRALLTIAAIVPLASSAATWVPEGMIKVFTSADGARVTIVPLAPKEEHRVVLYVEGTGSALDENPMVHKLREDGNKADYVRLNKGRDWVTMSVRAGHYALNVPGHQDDLALRFNDKKSGAAKAEPILAKLLLRKEAPSSFGRKAEEEKEEKRFKDLVAHANATCGSDIRGTIEWAIINEETLKSLQVGDACAAAALGAEALCDDQVGKDAVKAKLKKLTCKVGEKIGLALSGGSLNWTTAAETPEQVVFARDWIENQL